MYVLWVFPTSDNAEVNYLCPTSTWNESCATATPLALIEHLDMVKDSPQHKYGGSVSWHLHPGLSSCGGSSKRTCFPFPRPPRPFLVFAAGPWLLPQLLGAKLRAHR
mmetsp:Transcript_119725/g.168517  ORF Transcript_119725/g.168517 Transcript_119725/m.168517 type:complete len:107 (+) Transcript_119725:275-595(+)